MRYFYLYLFNVFFALILSACQKDTSPLAVGEDSQNTTYLNADGITLRLDSQKDCYNLDEPVTGIFSMVNTSDSSIFWTQTTDEPFVHFGFYNEENECIDYMPRFFMPFYFKFNFEPGDSISHPFIWNQATAASDHFDSLKTFAGRYFIKPTHGGISTEDFGKWIEISEEGDPLSTGLYFLRDQPDTLQIKFLVRNRISRPLTFELKGEKAIEIKFMDPQTDQVLRRIHPETGLSTLRFTAKSDSILFIYKIAKNSEKLDGIRGGDNCRINLFCKERIISAQKSLRL